MSWIEPKVDWKDGDVPGPGDFNRVEGNFLAERIAVFETSNNFIVPDGITWVWVSMCGAGGGGYNNSNIGYGGGSGKGVIRVKVPVNPGEIIPITIGKGGGPNAAGGASSFGRYLSCSGGSTTSLGSNGRGMDSIFGVGAAYAASSGAGIVADGYGSGGCSITSPYCYGKDGVVIVEY
jgi:hypothetical protein